MKNFIKEVYAWLVSLFGNLSMSYWYHFIFGVIIASFFAIVFSFAGYCILFVIAIAFLKEVIVSCLKGFSWKEFSWKKFLWTLSGGLIVFIFCLI